MCSHPTAATEVNRRYPARSSSLWEPCRVHARGRVAALIAVVLFALTGCGGATGSEVAERPTQSTPVPSMSSPVPVRMTADCVHFREQPREIMLACGDGAFYLQDISYSTWSRDSATGRAVAIVRFCPVVMGCGGRGETFRHAQSRIRLDRLRRVFGTYVFTRVAVTFLRTGRVNREVVLPLGCRITPPHCPRKRPAA